MLMTEPSNVSECRAERSGGAAAAAAALGGGAGGSRLLMILWRSGACLWIRNGPCGHAPVRRPTNEQAAHQRNNRTNARVVHDGS